MCAGAFPEAVEPAGRASEKGTAERLDGGGVGSLQDARDFLGVLEIRSMYCSMFTAQSFVTLDESDKERED